MRTKLSHILILISLLMSSDVLGVSNRLPDSDDGDEVYNMSMLSVQPEFPGGVAEMYKWLSENIKHPDNVGEAIIKGKIIVSFVIDKDGSVCDAKIIRGLYPPFDQEIIRVIKSMPKWRPGLLDGRPVKVEYTLPITFK